MLDEVQLLVRTDNPSDLEYLDIMLARNPDYYKRIDITSGGWTDQYSTLQRDVLYVKIGKHWNALLLSLACTLTLLECRR
jgi:hypothetical protein